MNIITAAESVLKSKMDKQAFEINSCIHDQSSQGSLDRLLKAVSSYERSASQYEVLQKVKSQVSSPEEETDTKDEG